MSDLTTVFAEADAEPIREPFLFKLDGSSTEFSLPALTGGGVPLDLLPAALLILKDNPTDDERKQTGVVFAAYLQQRHPKLWRAIAEHVTPVYLLNGLLRAWAAHSGVTDPKA